MFLQRYMSVIIATLVVVTSARPLQRAFTASSMVPTYVAPPGTASSAVPGRSPTAAVTISGVTLFAAHHASKYARQAGFGSKATTRTPCTRKRIA